MELCLKISIYKCNIEIGRVNCLIMYLKDSPQAIAFYFYVLNIPWFEPAKNFA